MIKSKVLSAAIVCTAMAIVISCSLEDSKAVKILVSATDSTARTIKINSYNILNLAPTLLTEAKIDSTGETLLEFTVPHHTFAYFEIGGHWGTLYLEPGYDLKLNLDTKKDKAISFSGNGAEPNNYLSQTNKISRHYDRKGGKFIFELTPFKFIDRLDSLKRDLASYHSEYCDSTDLSDSTSAVLALNNKLMLISMKQTFLMTNPVEPTYKDQVPEQLLNTATEIPFNDGLLAYGVLNYGLVLQLYLDLEFYRPFVERKKGIKDIHELLPLIVNDSLVKTKEYTAGTKEFLIAKNIDYHMESSGLIPAVDSLFNAFKQTYATSDYLPPLQMRANKWLAIRPGQIAPDFTGLTIDNKPLSLKDLRGKVVYIDVWATWCGPCREELPLSKKIQQLFKQNDKVVFLYASVDNNKAAWKEMVKNDKDAKCIHIIQQDEQFMQPYLIVGIPRYILIDHEGKIVKPHAARPSSGKVEQEIRELLRKIKS